MGVESLLVLLVPVGLLSGFGGAWWLGGRPDLARVAVSADEVRVVPVGVLKALAFRREVRFSPARISSVEVVAAPTSAAGVRGPGTGVPGLRAGTWAGAQSATFHLVGRADRVLRISLRDGPLAEVYLQVRDPEAVWALLAAAA